MDKGNNSDSQPGTAANAKKTGDFDRQVDDIRRDAASVRATLDAARSALMEANQLQADLEETKAKKAEEAAAG
eukprot:CAMPEP_0174895074 /NCGR_PEP_ID=MMETSP0167-20121228/9564_1 /TAXON_ID=38298 /ORGANISM="Rhodella maculata, Strain CCMP736" /LENGTH=72 /DNA_ID=CAMNT_0016134319 /DNA_START=170 /DNA_END=385 /DNA_ORIENTATION=+